MLVGGMLVAAGNQLLIGTTTTVIPYMANFLPQLVKVNHPELRNSNDFLTANSCKTLTLASIAYCGLYILTCFVL